MDAMKQVKSHLRPSLGSPCDPALVCNTLLPSQQVTSEGTCDVCFVTWFSSAHTISWDMTIANGMCEKILSLNAMDAQFNAPFHSERSREQDYGKTTPLSITTICGNFRWVFPALGQQDVMSHEMW